ncbi:MAG: electron transfer flavoprotein subunit beta/FixA family protein [Eubacteriaceae bacterium]|nr:electron transfer flavoprotein subunit beta/FixA family protein [Eubacteriaceae bacterium]
MKVIVCVKQVPNTNEVKIDPIKGTLIRDGIESILNPDDSNALEEALKVKDSHPGCTVTVITMGPNQAEDMLRECLAKGADEAILLSDRAFGGADTWATSNTIAAAIKKISNYDIIFAGRQAIDGDTAQVGPQIAERLGIPQVTYVQEFAIEGNEVTVQRQLEDGYMLISVATPVLLTTVKELNTPRHMSVRGIFDAYDKEIKVWSLADLDIKADTVGMKASPTKVFRSFPAKPKGKGIMLEGSIEEMTDTLVKSLKSKHII